MFHSKRRKIQLKYILISILILFFVVREADSRRRRLKKETVRKQALELIKNNSAEISELAGLQPNVDDSSEITLDELEAEFMSDEMIEEGEVIEELEREDDITVDMDFFRSMWLDYVTQDEVEEYTQIGVKKVDIMDYLMDWLGTRYRYGGTTQKGVDCSAFVRGLYKETAGILLPRTARAQFLTGEVVNRKDLEYGDLVFFHTRRRPYVSHVGIYLGDNLFAHASSGYGVTVSSLESKYYNKRFIGARRLTQRDVVNFQISKDENMSAKE